LVSPGYKSIEKESGLLRCEIVEAHPVSSGVVPLVTPVEHSEQVGGGQPRTERGCLLWLKLLDELMNRLEIGTAALVYGVIRFAFEGFELPGTYFEFIHVLAEMTDMIAYGGCETLPRIDDTLEAT
jgi:hypothetical protein